MVLGLRRDNITDVAGSAFLVADLAAFGAYWRLKRVVGGLRCDRAGAFLTIRFERSIGSFC